MNEPKKSILIISENKPRFYEVYRIVEKHFPTEYTDSHVKGFEILNERVEDFAAVLIDDNLVIQDNFEFLKNVTFNLKFSFIPVLIMLRSDYYENILNGLELGATDVLTPPFNEKIVINRIRNAIKIKDSMSFDEIEKMLSGFAVNIFLKDREGKYIFSTFDWHHYEHTNDPDWSIRGKTDVEVQNNVESAMKSMKDDMEIIHTGKVTDCIIETDYNNVKEFFHLVKHPVLDKEGNINGIFGILRNVTELENLKRQMQNQSVADNLKYRISEQLTDEDE